jgi:hypothetical protein
MLVATLLTLALNASPSDLEMLQRAEQQYQEGIKARSNPETARRHFQASWAAYEDLRRRGVHNADLYRNLGNAARLAEDLSQAILAYCRGLALEPGVRDLQERLEEARDLVAYPAGCRCRPEADPWPPWLPRPANHVLLLAAFLCYALACAGFTRWAITRHGLLLALAAAVLGGTVGFAWAWSWGQEEDARRHPVAVVKGTTPLRTGNGNSYPVLASLSAAARGMEGRLLYVRGDWLQIEFPGGEVGWLPRERVLLDR